MPSEEEIYGYLKKASIGVLALTLLLHLISFGSPHWGVTNHMASRDDNIGLWKYCSWSMVAGGGSAERCDDFIDVVIHDWQRATQAFMTLAMFGILASIGVFAMFIFVPDFQQNFKVFVGCWAVALTTALFVGISLATFAGKYEDWLAKYDSAIRPEMASLGWAYYLAAVAGFLLLVAPSLLVPDTYIALQSAAKPVKDPRLPYDL